ncbi:hypothetical protein ACIGBH_24710 [Streptomyces sp. NPDC085929]|uniref:hypothetical protein n=1 Tax=Streptomyces sp. NPDC085929 TaxID=3365739 RepID=UPI0037D2B368
MTAADPARSPAGTESAWASTHLPHRVKRDAGGQGLTGRWEGSESEAMADRMEEVVERYAPDFRARVLRRRVLAPPRWRRWTPTCAAAPSTAARPPCTSSSSAGRAPRRAAFVEALASDARRWNALRWNACGSC